MIAFAAQSTHRLAITNASDIAAAFGHCLSSPGVACPTLPAPDRRGVPILFLGRLGCRLIRLISISTVVVVVGFSTLLIARFGPSISVAPATARAAGVTGRFIWAAHDDGTIGVYHLTRPYSLVQTIHVFRGTANVRGATASAATHMFYVMYNQNHHGYVAKVDLLTHRVLWDKNLHDPGVDRGDVTPNGQTLYLPTWEGDPKSRYELVVNAVTGVIKGKITGGISAFPARSHDTSVSLDGKYVFMETKSPTGTLYIASTASNKIVKTITGYCCTRVLAPFSVNDAGTLVVDNVNGLYGFQVGSVKTGKVIATVRLTGTRRHESVCTESPGHPTRRRCGWQIAGPGLPTFTFSR